MALNDNRIEIYEAESAQRLFVLPAQSFAVRQIAFSADGSRLAVFGGSSRSVWDLERRSPLAQFEGSPAVSVAYSPDGRWIADCDGPTVTLYESASGKSVHEWTGAQRSTPIVFDRPGNRIAFVGADHTVRVCSVNDGKTLGGYPGHTGKVFSLRFSPDGERLASGGQHAEMFLWDFADAANSRIVRGYTSNVLDVAFLNHDRRILGIDSSGVLKVWDTIFDQKNGSIPLRGAWNASMTPDGRRIVATLMDEARVFDAQTGDRLLTIPVTNDRPWSVAPSPDGNSIAAAHYDSGTVQRFSLANGKQLARFPREGRDWPDMYVAFSPDGKRIAAGGQGGRISIWDSTSGRRLLEFGGHPSSITHLAFSHDGKALVSASGGLSMIDDALGPDGIIVPADGSAPGEIRVWNAATGAPLCTIDQLVGKTRAAAINGNGSIVAAGFANGDVCLYDARTGQRLRTIHAHITGVTALAFHPLEEYCLLSGDGEGLLKIWDAATGQQVLVLGRHSDMVNSIDFDESGERLVTLGLDEMFVWNATPAGRD